MFLDFHYHLAKDGNALKELLQDMDHAGVEITNLMGGPEDGFGEYKNCFMASNEDVLAAVKSHPDRLIGNVYLDPRSPSAADTLDRYIGEGFHCVKMPPIGFWPDDERWFPLYEKIEAYGVPLLLHAGQTNIKIVSPEPGVRKASSTKYAHPMLVVEIARLFPKMPIVLAHMGYPHYVDAWSVAHANPNVYLDISGSGPWTEGIPFVYNALGGSNFIPIGFSRVLWGSDNCLPQGEHIARSTVYMRQIGANSKDRKLIFGETAKKLLHI